MSIFHFLFYYLLDFFGNLKIYGISSLLVYLIFFEHVLEFTSYINVMLRASYDLQSKLKDHIGNKRNHFLFFVLSLVLSSKS